jgi:hypothetical protein
MMIDSIVCFIQCVIKDLPSVRVQLLLLAIDEMGYKRLAPS